MINNKRINQGIYFLLRKLGLQIEFDSSSFAHNATTLCKAEKESLPPAIYLQSHLYRFLTPNPYFTMKGEYERLLATSIVHEPTLLIPFKKSLIFSAGIINTKCQLYRRKVQKNNTETSINLDAGVLVDNMFSAIFFGHWLRDELPASLISNPSMPALALHKPKYSHASGYNELLQTNTLYGYRGKVKSLHLLVDFSQNSYKQNRYEVLKNRLNKDIQQKAQYQGVYIARGTSGTNRLLKNEEALTDHLTKRGFDVIFPEIMSASEIVNRLWNAPMVIGVEGSALSHSIYTLAKHGSMLILQPPHRICHSYKGILDARNHPYGFYVCKPDNDGDGFSVDSMCDLDSLIDRLREESARRFQAIEL